MLLIVIPVVVSMYDLEEDTLDVQIGSLDLVLLHLDEAKGGPCIFDFQQFSNNKSCA